MALQMIEAATNDNQRICWTYQPCLKPTTSSALAAPQPTIAPIVSPTLFIIASAYGFPPGQKRT